MKKTDDLMVPILRAMAENRCLEGIRIVDRHITDRRFVSEVVNILRTTVSLQSLELAFFLVCQNEMLDILNAIVANQTLSHVALRLYASTLHRMKAVLPFPILHSVRELVLDCNTSDDDADALFEFLDTNHQLCHLSVDFYEWNQSIMARLVQRCQLIPSLTKLSLTGHSFDDDSIYVLTQFLQTTASVRQLCVKLEYNTDPDPFLAVATVPTLLEKLTLLNVKSHCFDEWTASGSELRLEALHIHQSRLSEGTLNIQRLAQFIQDLRYLRELEVTLYDQNMLALSETLMPVLKRNFSLHHISLTWTTKYRGERMNVWDQDEAKLVRAFCQRNERLPLLLSGPIQPALVPMLVAVVRQSASFGALPVYIYKGLLHLANRNDGGIARVR
jgi:hypothetical protein